MQLKRLGYERVVDQMVDLHWQDLNRQDLMVVANAYYYFSVQFCETVEIACRQYPTDQQLIALRAGERDTDNLSPYPGIAADGERMNHDEFMWRVVAMSGLDQATRDRVSKLGAAYLDATRKVDPMARIISLPSYEDGGLERLFKAILRAPDWDEPSLAAFRHFLLGHIRLDSDPNTGHGSWCRHLTVDDRILPLWNAFRDILVAAVPKLAG